MEKSTRPCNFIYFSRSKWFCWTSMWLYMFSLHPSIIPGRRQCISSLCLSFDNLQCQISSMLTWWKVSSICYIVLFGFTTSALHFICPLFVDFDFCFYDLFSFFFLFQLTQSHFVSFDKIFFSPYFPILMCTNMAFHFIRSNTRAISVCHCGSKQKSESTESMARRDGEK